MTNAEQIAAVVWNQLGIDDPAKLTEFINNLRALHAGPGEIVRTPDGLALLAQIIPEGGHEALAPVALGIPQ